MLGWIVRLILFLAGEITSLFIAREALNFGIIQMVVGILLFTIVVGSAVFWPELKILFFKIKKLLASKF